MGIKSSIIGLINKHPYVKALHQQINLYKQNSCFPPAHFYSPIVSVEEMKQREKEIWGGAEKDGVRGIDLQVQAQIKLFEKFSSFYSDLPFKQGKDGNLRYYFENEYYSYTDGIVLYSMIRQFNPKKIIEIGSGFSSALMLDTNQLFFQNGIDLTFIEPFPDRLNSLMSDADRERTKVIEKFVQNVSVETFEALAAGDILFVDSTHVAKTGSDVNYILFEILPSLKPGVIIHFHDVFYPFEYPKEWVFKGKNWNEDYFLRAFLMYNNAFEMLAFSDYLHKFHKEVFAKMPLCYKNHGGNLWIRKVK